MSTAEAKSRRAGLKTPTNLGRRDRETSSRALNLLLADPVRPVLKTKNFHWQSRARIRDYHLLLESRRTDLAITTPCRAQCARWAHDAAHRSPDRPLAAILDQ